MKNGYVESNISCADCPLWDGLLNSGYCWNEKCNKYKKMTYSWEICPMSKPHECNSEKDND